MKLSEIINPLEKVFPKSNMEEWDNVGLMVGDRDMEIKKIQVSLDVTMNVIDNAIKNNIDLIISHHPFIFNPIKNINTDSLLGRKILKLIENRIAVYSLHTNLDSSKNGLNDFVGEIIGLKDGKIIDPVKENYYKAVFSTCDIEKTENELKKESVNFDKDGDEKFILVLKKDKLYNVIEKLKTKSLVNDDINIVKLENSYGDKGIGRIYSLKEKTKLSTIIEEVKEKFEIKSVIVSGNNIEEAIIKKIAIVNGAGSSYWKKAKRMGADLLITGDLKYHEALDAKEEGMYIMDIGHYESERFFYNIILNELKNIVKNGNLEISVFNDEPVLKKM